MTHEGLDEGLITRLREKYAHMSRNAQKSNPDEDGTCKGPSAACGSSMPALSQSGCNTMETSSRTAICGVCNGSGDRCYEYNFRRMTEQCKQCNGDGIIRPTAGQSRTSSKAANKSTFNPASKRVMTHLQMERIKVLNTQLSKIQRKIDDLQDERAAISDKVLQDAGQGALQQEILRALDKAVASLESAKQSRQDRLSYYDGMVKPESDSQAVCGPSSEQGSVGSGSTETTTAALDST